MSLLRSIEQQILVSKQVASLLGVEEEMISEANVANIKQPIGSDTTIVKYLTNYAKEFPEEYRAPFIKKMTNLLINDERYLFALRDLPDNAPDWAKTAVATGQLMVFQPNQELNDKMTHMTHFISAADHDSKQTADHNQQVFAQRELQGFGKAENLDVLVKKSNEYFARGSRSAKRDESGMEKVYDAKNGFTWWKLTEPAAFEREGKTLQNCIGTNYTLQNTLANNTAIIVLRDPKGNTVAASRLKELGNKKYQIEELKGKQNKPPIDAYMPPVLEIVNKMGLTLTSGAVHDFDSAGYIYYKDKLYTAEQAIKQFTAPVEIAPMSGGNKLVKVGTEIPGLLRRMYPSLGYNVESNDIYEARTAEGQPLVTFSVDPVPNKYYVQHEKHQPKPPEIQYILVHNQTRGSEIFEHAVPASNSTGATTQSIIKEMYGLLRQYPATKDLDFNSSLTTKLNWIHGIGVDNDKRELTDVSHDRTISDDDANWDVYDDPRKVKSLVGGLSRDYHGRINKKDLKQIYRWKKEGTMVHGFGISPTNEIVPIKLDAASGNIYNSVIGFDYDSEYARDDGVSRTRDQAFVKSMIKLANEHGYKIPDDLAIEHFILKDNDGQYVRRVPQPLIISREPQAIKYDLSSYPPESRKLAFKHINKDADFKREDDAKTGNRFTGKKEALTELEPDSLIYVNIAYGVEKAHTVILAVKNNTIEAIDDKTREHGWQAWNDYKRVADQLNDFAKKQNLEIGAKIGSNSREFTVVKGQIVTRSDEMMRKAQGRVDRGSAEGTDKIAFSNGFNMKKASAEELTNFARQKLSSSTNRGDFWMMEEPVPHNANFGMFVSNKKVYRIVNLNTGTPVYGIKSQMLPYIKTAADTFGWDTKTSPELTVSPKNTDVIKQIDALGDEGPNGKSMVGHDANYYDRLLMDRGLAQIVTATIDGYRTKRLKFTASGRNAYARGPGTPIDLMNGVTGVGTHESFVKPAGPQARTATVATPGQPRAAPQPMEGGNTKAALAIQKFREMTATSGTVPSASQFIPVLMAAPFNMSKLGAQTYYYNTKKKVGSQAVGEGSHLMAAFLTPGMSMLREFEDLL